MGTPRAPGSSWEGTCVLGSESMWHLHVPALALLGGRCQLPVQGSAPEPGAGLNESPPSALANTLRLRLEIMCKLGAESMVCKE